MDDRFELIKALIDAERRNAEAFREVANHRLNKMEEIQTSIVRRVLMWAGGLIVLVGLLSATVFVLEWLGPTRFARIFLGGP